MKNKRPAFTLVELLTVIGIILILAMLIVGVVYSSNTKQTAANGATAIVGWCKTAQSLALRDQKPYGLRFDFSATHLVTMAQYLEQPADWTSQSGSTITSSFTKPSTIHITLNGGGTVTFATGSIQAGDYLECQHGQMATVFSVNSPTKLTCTMMAGDTSNMWTFASTKDFRVIRQPRAMLGGDVLSLPANVAIDLDTSNLNPPAPQYKTQLPIQGTGVQIIFAPNGTIIGNPGMVRLWVRDTSAKTISPGVFEGEQFIVTINGTTGMVGIQPVNITLSGGFYGTPYSFTQDGKSGGF